MMENMRREILGLLMNRVGAVSITILIILSLGLLLWSNIARTAWVRLEFYVVEDDSYDTDIDENVYSLKLWNTIKTLWNSDSYYLAIIIFILSLLFTYIKMFLVILGIWVPMHWTPRAKMLSVLSQLGKLAMALVFLIIFLVNAVHQVITATVTVSSSSSSSEYDLYFELTIELDYAIVLFTLAIIFSMILTETVLSINKQNRHDSSVYQSIQYSHNTGSVAGVGNDNENSVSHSNNRHGGGGGGGGSGGVPTYDRPGWDTVDRGVCCGCCPESMILRAPICISMYTKCQEGGFKAFCLESIKRIIMLGILCLCIVTTLLTYSEYFIKIEYTGDIADYMENPTRKYSFRDFGILESENTDYKSYSTWIAILYELFVVALPLLVIALLICLWFIPFPNFIYKRIRPFIWYCNAWAMLDIMFLVAIGAGYTYADLYNTVVDDEIEDYCDDLSDYISADCAGVDVTVLDGTWYALIASVTLWISVIYSVYYTDDAYQWTNEEAADSVGPNENNRVSSHYSEEEYGLTTQV